MTTGYLGTATTPDPRVSDLERRIARLESELEKRDHEAEMRRMWRWYYASCALMPVGTAILVYLAASLN